MGPYSTKSIMANRRQPRAFIKTALHNGIGRYVCQLQRLTLKFCKSHAGSQGVRNFIEEDLLEFTHNHPGVVVYLKPRRHRTAILTAEYLNGNSVNLNLHMKPRHEVRQWVEQVRVRSGEDIAILVKPWHTFTPSIQGIWTPFTNKPSIENTYKFPSDNYVFKELDTSATEEILQKMQKLKTND